MEEVEVLDVWKVKRDPKTGKSVLVGFALDGSLKKVPLKIEVETFTEEKKKD